MTKHHFQWDLFISHANEDKEDFVRPLARALGDRGVKVWYDEFTLKLGDSLRRSIDKGLVESRYGLVVLSKSFFMKEWPQRELDALVAREIHLEKVIIPIWHGVTHSDVCQLLPTLADRLAVDSSNGIGFVVDKILDAIHIDRCEHHIFIGHPSKFYFEVAETLMDCLGFARITAFGYPDFTNPIEDAKKTILLNKGSECDLALFFVPTLDYVTPTLLLQIGTLLGRLGENRIFILTTVKHANQIVRQLPGVAFITVNELSDLTSRATIDQVVGRICRAIDIEVK